MVRDGKKTPPSSSLAITDLQKQTLLTTINDAIRRCKSDVDRQCISPFGMPFSASSHRRPSDLIVISTSPSANCNPFSASGNLRGCTTTSNILERADNRPCVFVPCFLILFYPFFSGFASESCTYIHALHTYIHTSSYMPLRRW